MIDPHKAVYPAKARCIWVFCDIREPAVVRFVHEARALFQEHSDLAGFGPDYLILMIFPGGAREAAA